MRRFKWKARDTTLSDFGASPADACRGQEAIWFGFAASSSRVLAGRVFDCWFSRSRTSEAGVPCSPSNLDGALSHLTEKHAFRPRLVLTSPAQQGARANGLLGHASCFRTPIRNEASDRKPNPSTSRARAGRGSSLTFGKKKCRSSIKHPAQDHFGVVESLVSERCFCRRIGVPWYTGDAES